jgi:hypothetical protein
VAGQTKLMEPASTIYEAAIVERAKTRTRRRIVPTIDDDLRPEKKILQDLIIRRRSDGEVIVRTPADLGSPDALLETVRGDLGRMTADEFLDEWKLPVV